MGARTTGPAAAPMTAPTASQSGLNTPDILADVRPVSRPPIRTSQSLRRRSGLRELARPPYDQLRPTAAAEGVHGGWRGRFRGVRPCEAQRAGPVGLSADRRCAS